MHAANTEVAGISPAKNGPANITPAAQRALSEAAARRAAQPNADLPKELQGRDGPDPVRFGDWEVNGRAIDF